MGTSGSHHPSPSGTTVRNSALFAGLLATTAALAPTDAFAKGDKNDKKFKAPNTVTVDALKLTWPAFEAEYERKLSNRMGVAGFAGMGRFWPLVLKKRLSEAGVPEDALSFWDLGARFNVYALGRFENGLNLGVTTRVRQLKATTSSDDIEATAKVRSFYFGPHLGYKLAFRPGVTLSFLGSAGYHKYGAITAEAGGSSANLGSFKDQPTYGVLANLNVGWTF